MEWPDFSYMHHERREYVTPKHSEEVSQICFSSRGSMPQLKIGGSIPNLLLIQRKYAATENQRKYPIFYIQRKYTATRNLKEVWQCRFPTEYVVPKNSEEVCQIGFSTRVSMSYLKIRRKYDELDFQPEGVCRSQKSDEVYICFFIRGSLPNLIFFFFSKHKIFVTLI